MFNAQSINSLVTFSLDNRLNNNSFIISFIKSTTFLFYDSANFVKYLIFL